MQQRPNYWIRRVNSSRLSRRRFMGAATATGAGAAGLALVGCGNDDDDDTAAPTPTDDDDDTGPAPTPTPDGEPEQGGVWRGSSADATFDTFDADRSRFTPFASMLGWSHLNIVHYRSFADGGDLIGAFAESWQIPDDTTMTFHLRPGVTWHDKPPLNGRATTAEDMQFFIERNKNGTLLDGTEDPSFWRKASYGTVESVETTDESTVTVRFSRPYPFFLGLLAGSYAKVQAREVIEEFEGRFRDLPVESMVGSGPFLVDHFDPEGRAAWSRNPNHYEPVSFDGLEWVPLFADTGARQAAFEQKDIDEIGGLDIDTLNDYLTRLSSDLYNTPSFSANPMAGTYWGGPGSAWEDRRLIGAIFRSIDRRLLIEQLLQGAAAISGNIPPTQVGWGISEEELITFEGYWEDHEADLAEARQMWEAANGPDIGTITVDIPDIWEGLYSGVAESVTGMLRSNLGNNFQAQIENYATISGKVADGSYGRNGVPNIWYGWISDVQELEPTLGLWQAYNSSAPGFVQFNVQIDEVDQLTEQALVEFDLERRVEISADVERHLLRNWGAGIPHNLLGINNTLRWNYFHVGESPPFSNTHNHHRDRWFDTSDPTWQGRRA